MPGTFQGLSRLTGLIANSDIRNPGVVAVVDLTSSKSYIVRKLEQYALSEYSVDAVLSGSHNSFTRL